MAKRSSSGVYKDPRSPFWQFDAQCRGHRLRGSSETEDRRQAEDMVEAWRTKIRQGAILERMGVKAPKEMSLNEAVTRYFEEVGCQAKSSDQIDENLAWLVKNFNQRGAGAGTLLSGIDESMITEAAAKRRALGSLRTKQWAPLSEARINRAVIELLRTVMRRAAITWKVQVATIDWKNIRAPECPEGLMSRELSIAKERDLFRRLRKDLHSFIRFLLLCGARSGALRQLEWRDVDFDAKQFRVRRKTRKPGVHWQPLPLTQSMIDILKGEQGRHARYVFTYVLHKDLGKYRAGSRLPITQTVLRKQMEAAMQDAGIEDFRVHDLRHTMARRALRGSKNIRAVQRALGHSKIETTTIYADVLLDDVREVMEAAEKAGRKLA